MPDRPGRSAEHDDRSERNHHRVFDTVEIEVLATHQLEIGTGRPVLGKRVGAHAARHHARMDLLPRQALVVALSPLHDQRFVRALIDLRTRGIDVVAVELSPLHVTPPTPGQLGDLAHRLWKLLDCPLGAERSHHHIRDFAGSVIQ